MGILEELEPRQSLLKELDDFLASLKAEERAEWDLVLGDPAKYPPAPIVAALRRRGIKINRNAIYRFRNRLEELNAR